MGGVKGPNYLGVRVPLEKEIATHSSTLDWKIPWMEEPGRLQSMESRHRTRLKRLRFHFHRLPGKSNSENTGGGGKGRGFH